MAETTYTTQDYPALAHALESNRYYDPSTLHKANIFTFDSILCGRRFASESIVIPDDITPSHGSYKSSNEDSRASTPVTADSHAPLNLPFPSTSDGAQAIIPYEALKDLIKAATSRAPLRALTTRHLGRPRAFPKYCGGARELDKFLRRLEHDSATYSHHFSSEALKVDYNAINNLATWAEHPDPKLPKEAELQNPISWATIQLQITAVLLRLTPSKK